MDGMGISIEVMMTRGIIKTQRGFIMMGFPIRKAEVRTFLRIYIGMSFGEGMNLTFEPETTTFLMVVSIG